MVVMATYALPRGQGGAFTVEDLDALPEDGNRYELVDGVLLVSAAPVPRHQWVQRELMLRLDAGAGRDWVVLAAPTDVRVGVHTSLEPDLVVIARAAVPHLAGFVPVPTLCVEVLSPSTRKVDVGTKSLALAAIGVPSYWLVDPAVPSILVRRLVGDGYLDDRLAVGEELLEVQVPYPVALRPADLVRELPAWAE